MKRRLDSPLVLAVSALLFVATPVAFAQAQDADGGDDGGTRVDAGDDAGTIDDGGSLEDAGTQADAGSALDAGVHPDAGVIEPPDGSVGEGGADRDNPEAEDSVGRIPTTCTQTIDCAVGFQCQHGLCRYSGVRDATGGFGCGGGCGATSGGPEALVLLALGAMLLRRVARRRAER